MGGGSSTSAGAGVANTAGIQPYSGNVSGEGCKVRSNRYVGGYYDVATIDKPPGSANEERWRERNKEKTWYVCRGEGHPIIFYSDKHGWTIASKPTEAFANRHSNDYCDPYIPIYCLAGSYVYDNETPSLEDDLAKNQQWSLVGDPRGIGNPPVVVFEPPTTEDDDRPNDQESYH